MTPKQQKKRILRGLSLLFTVVFCFASFISCNPGSSDFMPEDPTDSDTISDATEVTTSEMESNTLGGGVTVLQPDPEKPEAPENPEISLYDMTSSTYDGGKLGCTKVTVLSEYTVGLDYDIYADKNSNRHIYYLYLPCRVDLSKVTFSVTHRDGSVSGPYTVNLSDDEITDNERLVATTNTYTIKAMQSNLPTVMVQIDEQYVTIDKMNGDPNHNTFAYGDMVTTVTDEMALANGWATRYASADTNPDKYCSLDMRGRGNTTWNMAKKPYQIRSENEIDLLGMGLATTYALMANYRDAIGSRTQLALDLGQALELDYTSEQRQVDFFLNGIYMGMYVIAEKVEVAPNRVEIDQTEDILFEIDQYYSESGNIGIGLTQYNSQCRFRIHSPTEEDTVERSKQVITEAIEALYSGDEQAFLSYFDLNSWARMYLLQIYSMNSDAYHGSLYFYYSNDDGKLHACSPWDFDWSFGGSHREDPIWWDPYLCDRSQNGISKALLEYPSFVTEVLDVYYHEGAKEVLELVPQWVLDYAEENRRSFAMSEVASTVPISYYPSGGANSYDAAVYHLYTVCVDRLDWMETKMASLAESIDYVP